MQMNLDLSVELPKNLYDYGSRTSGETHGVVLTKPHVVDLILDLAGYTADADLAQKTLLEPACGHGAFLVSAVLRLLDAATRDGIPASQLGDALEAFDVNPEHVRASRSAVRKTLLQRGVAAAEADRLVRKWIKEADFLLTPIPRRPDFVVGNPPYVRIEQLAPPLHAEYRRRYQTLYDRADLYVAFIERALSLLSPRGVLSFICADRWTSNRYGAPLRKLIARGYRVSCYVDLHEASPFESEVIAYPSIFVLSRGESSNVPVVKLHDGSPEECKAVSRALSRPAETVPEGVSLSIHERWFREDEPWVLSSPLHLRTLRSLEAEFAPISKTCRVGIGVATGNDAVYITDSDADIEPDRLVPLVMRDDIAAGKIRDAKRFVINTFEGNGRVVDLSKYPRLAAYIESREPEIRRRHVAKKNPNSWFRTIDRVYPELVSVPKLLIPDIAGSNEVALDPGQFHPHHNLYFVTSQEWDMEVLGGLLSSKVALFFIWSYAVKMRGSYLRFQAQYLRRICLPDPHDIEHELKERIRTAFRARDFAQLDKLALRAYRLKKLPEFDFVDTRR